MARYRIVVAIGWLVLLLPSRLHGQDDAQKLFDLLEQKLAAAKAIKIAFEVEAKAPSGALSMKGILIITKDNRMRLIYDGQTEQKSKVTWISDGKTLAMQTELLDKTAKASKPTPEQMHRVLSGCFSRASLVSGTNSIARPIPSDPFQLKPSAFQAVTKEKIGDKAVNLIQFDSLTPAGNAMKCKLWLDTKTNLPVKRLMEFTTDGELRLRSAETYSEWTLDPAFPEGTFELPK
jgi:outer membrane lipoprotein-sorting protein